MAAQILITGGTGYIGSHTAVEFLKQGQEVVLLDNLHNSEQKVLDAIQSITGKQVHFYQADVRDAAQLHQICTAHPSLHTVVHFAALKSVGESVANPLSYYEVNVGGLVQLLSVMQHHSIKQMIFSSSCTVYGVPKQLPVDETAPVQPAASPYGRTKQMGEDILSDYAQANPDFRAIALRYFNPVGAHPSARLGELPRGVPANLMPFITQTAYGLREGLQIFGDDYDTPDGTCLRDYIHVVDLALAHLRAAQRLQAHENLQNFEVFNIGTGRGISVLEMIHAFEEVNQIKLPYRIAPRRAGDVPMIYADPQRANEVLGWQAQHTLADMVASAWAWEQAYRRATDGE